MIILWWRNGDEILARGPVKFHFYYRPQCVGPLNRFSCPPPNAINRLWFIAYVIWIISLINLFRAKEANEEVYKRICLILTNFDHILCKSLALPSPRSALARICINDKFVWIMNGRRRWCDSTDERHSGSVCFNCATRETAVNIIQLIKKIFMLMCLLNVFATDSINELFLLIVISTVIILQTVLHRHKFLCLF